MATKKVRILVDCHYGRAGDVAAMDTTRIKEAKLAGLIDDHPDAVKHAEGLKASAEPGAPPLDLPPAASTAPDPVSPETGLGDEDGTHQAAGTR